MSESITLFCRVMCDDSESFLKRLTLLASTAIERDLDARWSRISCRTSTGSVDFNRLFFTEVGDKFAKQRWTTIVKVNRKKEEAPEAAKRVDDHLEHTEMIIGIVANPGFDEIDKLPELIGYLAMEFDALIFNGSQFMDFGGNEVLAL